MSFTLQISSNLIATVRSRAATAICIRGEDVKKWGDAYQQINIQHLKTDTIS